MFFHYRLLKCTAFIVTVAYLSVLHATSILAAESPFSIDPQLFAQAEAPENAAAISDEEREIQQRFLEEQIRDAEADMNRAKGIRRNLLTVSIATLAAGGTINFAVNQVNDSIEDIPSNNPETGNPDGTIEERVEDCVRYVCTSYEIQDTQSALDGIKGIGGGIFLVGAAGLLSYFLYSRTIGKKQDALDDMQAELSGTFGVSSGFSPDYLQKNEAATAIVEEINSIKKSAGKSRTTGEVFSTLAFSGVLSGLFLVGVSNVSTDLIEDIAVSENDPDEVAAKEDALDTADSMAAIGWTIVGLGGASGLASYVFYRRATSKDAEVNDLEEGLLRFADGLRIQPRLNGVMLTYRYDF